jgi:hypothetical protein
MIFIRSAAGAGSERRFVSFLRLRIFSVPGRTAQAARPAPPWAAALPEVPPLPDPAMHRNPRSERHRIRFPRNLQNSRKLAFFSKKALKASG